MTLSQALLPSNSTLNKALMVVAGSVFVAIAAQIAIPWTPVPLTLQTLAVLLVGLSLGSRLGAAALTLYALEGAAGLPVFANGGAGLAYMAGPTGGFIIGFILMAWIAGLSADFGYRRILPVAFFSFLAAIALYIPGLAWPYAIASAFGVEAGWAGTSIAKLWAGWMQPFLLGDTLKAVLAAMIVTGAWDAIARRKS